ncbi:MAG: hypothetical protein HY319_05255 [Armatimonadetes bacterium]|nr:hypothetical protein [Armatimonadota bacterium]
MNHSLRRMLQRLKTLRPVRLRSAFWSWEAEAGFSLSDQDLEATLVRHEGPPLLFGKFPIPQLMHELESAGILERIRQRGYTTLRPEAGAPTAFEDRFRLWADHPKAEHPCLLIDVRTQIGEVEPSCPCCREQLRFRALIWDWISFQDPVASFAPGREALPGQEHPGLGVFREATRLMLGYVHQMDVEAVVAVPEYFHNAVLYSALFHFYDGRREGRFQAWKRDLLPAGLARASHALAAGQVLPIDDPNAEPVSWSPAEQVYALADRVAEHFEHPDYLRKVATASCLDYVLL